LGVLIVLALAVLVAGLFIKLGGHKASGEATGFTPPPGARLVTTEVSGDRLILHLRVGSTDEVDIVDTQNGHLISRLVFAPARP
jgi:hypothetical protein